MRAVVQRVSQAQVSCQGRLIARLGKGLLVLVGIDREDALTDVHYLADKIAQLRVFENDQGKMNLTVEEVSGEILVVSQFTLLGDCRKGRRPSFSQAAAPEKARELYERFVHRFRELGLPVQTGVFQESMEVGLVNDGPVTLMLDSKRLF